MEFEEKTLKREIIYDGAIIKVAVDDVALPNGKEGKRELVFHNGGVGILALTPEGKAIFARQFRKALEKVILEIPAGKIEQEESDPLATAKRELEEETTYQAENWTKITSMIPSPGFCNEVLHLYVARGLKKIENPLPQDEDEVLELVELTLAEAKDAIRNGTICDAKTIIAIQYWELEQQKTKE